MYDNKTEEKDERASAVAEESKKRKKFFASKLLDSTKSLFRRTAAAMGVAFTIAAIGTIDYSCNKETQNTKDTQEEVVEDEINDDVIESEQTDEDSHNEIDGSGSPSFCKTVQEEPLDFDLPRTSKNTSFSISYVDANVNLNGSGDVYPFVNPEESIMMGECDDGGIAFLFLPNREYRVVVGGLAEIKTLGGSLPSMDGTKCDPLQNDTAPLRSVKDGENEIKKGITKNINYDTVPSQAMIELGSVASVALNVDGSQHTTGSLIFDDLGFHVVYAMIEEGELPIQLTAYSEIEGMQQEKNYIASINHPAALSKTVYAIIADRLDLAHSTSNEYVDPLPDSDYNAILFCGRCNQYTTINVAYKINIEQIKKTTRDGNNCPDSVGFDITCEEPVHGPDAFYYLLPGTLSLSSEHVETESPSDILVNFVVVRDNIRRDNDYGEINFIHINIPCRLTYTIPKINETMSRDITISPVLVDPEAINDWDTSFPNEYAAGGKCYDPVTCQRPDVWPY